jgi:type II secretory pathway predicted ATPase ExeA
MKNAPNLELSLLARQWGATSVPFSEPAAQAWLETPQNQRAVAALDQTATLRSVLLLAGPNGVGKSALVSRWLSRLDRRLFCPLLLTHASLSGCGLLSTLVSQLGKRPAFRRESNLALIEAALAELGKVVPLIILDEAQGYSYSSLEEIRLLLGLNLAEPPAFALVLIGDEYLLGTLWLRQHRSLFSRIAFQVNLAPWTAPLVAEYLQQSLAVVGITRPAIEPAALNLLTSASSGLARSLCLLARAAWIQAASEGAQIIQPPHVQTAIEQVPGAAGQLSSFAQSNKPMNHLCLHPLRRRPRRSMRLRSTRRINSIAN